MTLFQNKYRIASARAPWWDYGADGAYFITICTKDRAHYFGVIRDDNMQLSQLGNIVTACWQQIPQHHATATLDEFVAMPNHVHGILIINNPDHAPFVETGQALSLPAQQRFRNQGKNALSSIVGSFKSAVTKQANISGIPNGWQQRF